MYDFNNDSLAGELGKFSAREQVAFAAAAATRQLTSYERYARKFQPDTEKRPREIVEALWTDLKAGSADLDTWSETLDEVMDLMPEETELWEIEHPLAEDAMSSLAYAIRCLLTPEPKEAVWAAQAAYEAADQAAIRVLDIQTGLPETEKIIKLHEFVQRELARQQQNLDLLRTGSIAQLQTRAFSETLLTPDEWSLFDKPAGE